jgi:phospholipid transport system substrate-binding protein
MFSAGEFMFRKIALRLWIILGISTIPLPSSVTAGVPTDQLRTTIDRVLEILEDKGLKSDDKRQERRNLLRDVISARFNFAEMAKRSLGAEWRRLTPQQQQEFVELFTDLIQDAYIGDIESYRGEKITFTRERVDQEYAEVESLLTNAQDATYTMNYRLHLLDKEWRVYDVVIEDVSVVNNYRSQFSRIVTRSSYEDLVRRMKEKTVPKQK